MCLCMSLCQNYSSWLIPDRVPQVLNNFAPLASSGPRAAGLYTYSVQTMDQISIKTPNPKCRLFWCLIEFIDWRYSQSCGIFDPSCELTHL
jgi:hypothetical protein